MRLKYSTFSHSPAAGYKSQGGSVLVLAIFIMIVMLLLGTALVRMLSTSSESIAYEVVGTRAYNAANSGLQARLAELFPISLPAQLCEPGAASPTSDTRDAGTADEHLPNLLNVPGLRNCRIQRMSCEDFTVGNTIYYQLSSTAECDMGSGEVVSRTVVVEARSL